MALVPNPDTHSAYSPPFLVLDTSMNACLMALFTENKTYLNYHLPQHSHDLIRQQELLPSGLKLLCQQASVKISDLKAIYFGHGPGSFTGCRVGAAFALGIALGTQISIHSLSSFSLIAQNLFNKKQIKNILILHDAQKEDFYLGFYQWDEINNSQKNSIPPVLFSEKNLSQIQALIKKNINSNSNPNLNANPLVYITGTGIGKLEKLNLFKKNFLKLFLENSIPFELSSTSTSNLELPYPENADGLIQQNMIFPPEVLYLREATDWKLTKTLPPLKTYIVGGAVRDKLLGLTPKEIDTLVIGATPEEMKIRGFIPVGKHFPVFLHPETKAEFALARTERKTTLGHQGFEFFTDPNISIEEDLKRRDFTINAIAEDERTHQLIDPYGGQIDLKNKILRHVSDAFIEDPLRVFRAARFLAQLGEFNFKLAPETLALLSQISTQNQGAELKALSDERIWKETFKALTYPKADLFFKTLYDAQALTRCFTKILDISSSLNRLKKVNTNDKNGFINQKNKNIIPMLKFVSFAFKNELDPSFKNKLPKDYLSLLNFAEKFYPYQDNQNQNFFTAETLLDVFYQADFFRRPELLQNFILLSDCLGLENTKVKSWENFKNLLIQASQILSTLNTKNLEISHLNGPEIAAMIKKTRLGALSNNLKK